MLYNIILNIIMIFNFVCFSFAQQSNILNGEFTISENCKGYITNTDSKKEKDHLIPDGSIFVIIHSTSSTKLWLEYKGDIFYTITFPDENNLCIMKHTLDNNQCGYSISDNDNIYALISVDEDNLYTICLFPCIKNKHIITKHINFY